MTVAQELEKLREENQYLNERVTRMISESRIASERKADQVADCVLSLSATINQAGGSVPFNLLELTLGEVITNIFAQNNIRFIHIPVVKDGEQAMTPKKIRKEGL